MKKYLLFLIVFILLISCSEEETPSYPTIITDDITNIESTYATCTGEVITDGGSNIIERGIYWGNNSTPDVNVNRIVLGEGLGSFNTTITELTPGSTYYVKAYAINSVGTAYGEEKEFTTLSSIPTVKTFEPSDIESTYATCFGKVISDGKSDITERGICWNTTPTPDINENKIAIGTGLGSFNTIITELIPGTKYYVRAYATNSVGTAYGEELEFTTLTKHLMFTKDRIWKHAFQNSTDKLLYFFTQKNSNTSSPITIVAYNYILKQVSTEKEIGSYGIGMMPLHSIAMYNGQMELYIIYENTVQILDAITLEEITRFEITGVNSLTSIRQENNLLFIGVWDSENNNVLVYSRETLTQISQGIHEINARAITTYYNSETNNIYCISFPQFSNERYVIVDAFDNTGNYVSSTFLNNYSDNNLIRTNNNSNVVIKGEDGHLYYKSDFSEFLSNNDSMISTSGSLADYQISSDGNTVYTIQGDYSVRLYNSSDFSNYQSIEINEKGRNLFIDGEDIFIIDYKIYSTEDTKVYLSEY